MGENSQRSVQIEHQLIRSQRRRFKGAIQPFRDFFQIVNKYSLLLSHKAKYKRYEQQLNVQKAGRFRIIGVLLGLPRAKAVKNQRFRWIKGYEKM
jgi:hypothetical protein